MVPEAESKASALVDIEDDAMTEAELLSRTAELAMVLSEQDAQLVLAESCTAGLIAALLSRTPGVSAHFCGSQVVYQNATKTAWLNVDAAMLEDPARGPVCDATAVAMATHVLERTPLATISGSVTGHLGPNAPAELDGVVYIGCALRQGGRIEMSAVRRLHLPSDVAASTHGSLRLARQYEAAGQVVKLLVETLTGRV